MSRGQKRVDLAKYYRLLPTFPRSTAFIAFGTFAISLVGSYASLFLLEIRPFPLAWKVSLPFLAAPFLDRLILRRDRILDLRRCFCVSLFCALLLPPSLLVGGWILTLLGKDPSLSVATTLSFLFSTRLVIFSSVSSKHAFRGMLASATLPVLAFLASGVNAYLPFSASLVASLALVDLGLLWGNKVILSETSVPGSRLTKAFALNWVVDEWSPLDSLLHELGEDVEVEADVITLHTEKGERAIVIPYFHPGPFKNVGSSDMSAKIVEAFEERGVPAVVLHGASEHDFDLASRKETVRVAEAIAEGRGGEPLEGFAGPLVLEEKGRIIEAFSIGDFPVFVLSKEKGMEDIPVSFKRDLEASFGDCAVVDAHNGLGDPPSEEDLAWFKEKAGFLLKRLRSSPRKPFKFGVGRLHYRDAEIGSAGVIAFIIEVGGEKCGFVVFDSNNAVPELSKEIESKLGARLLTTDTHELVASLPGGMGYVPLGQRNDWGTVLQMAEDALRLAEEDLSSVKRAYRSRLRIRAKVAGKWLTETAEKVPCLFRKVVSTILASIAAAGILSIVFLLLA